jgi:hypothetical protein
LYENEKEKDIEKKVKILHKDGIIDCFFLTESVADTLIGLSSFFTQRDKRGILTFLSYKENVYFDDKQMEKIFQWFKSYKHNHKIKKTFSNDNTNKEWSNEEIEKLKDIAIKNHVEEKSDKRNVSKFPEIFIKFDESVRGRSFQSVKTKLLSKDFFTREKSELHNHLSTEDEDEAIKLVEKLWLYTQNMTLVPK